MAHAQKPDLVFQRKGRVHLYRRGCQFSRLLAAEVCASAVVMLDRPCSHTVHECWIPTPFASFPFTSPPVLRRVPSDSVSTLPDVVTPCYTGAPLFSSFIRITKSRRKGGPKNGRTKYKVVCLSVTLLISSILPAFPLALLPHFFRVSDSVVGTWLAGETVNR